MALHRCLLIACVTLSQACDSKQAAPVAEKLPAPLQIVVDADEPTDRMFEALRTATAEQVVLVIGGTSYPVHYTSRAFADGPGMIAMLGRAGDVGLWSTSGTEGTPEKPRLVTPLDEPGRNTIRAVLAEIVTRTGAKRIDVIVDRIQPARALAALLQAVRPPFEDVRVAAGVPTTPAVAAVFVSVEGIDLHTATGEHEESLRRCFQESLRLHGTVTAVRMTVEIRVDDQGAVSPVRVSGAYARPLADCVSLAVTSWKLAVKPGTYTFQLDMKAR